MVTTVRLPHSSAHPWLLGAVLGAIVVALGASPSGQGIGAPERFQAFAVDLPDVGPTRSGPVEIVISRWPGRTERESILAALDQGQSAFMRELERTPRVGYVRTPASTGWDLHYVDVVEAADGGRTITLLTDRPIGMWESFYRPPSIDYPVTWIQLKVDRDGRGEGTMFEAARVSGSLTHRFMVLENYASRGIRLMNVQSRRPNT